MLLTDICFIRMLLHGLNVLKYNLSNSLVK